MGRRRRRQIVVPNHPLCWPLSPTRAIPTFVVSSTLCVQQGEGPCVFVYLIVLCERKRRIGPCRFTGAGKGVFSGDPSVSRVLVFKLPGPFPWNSLLPTSLVLISSSHIFVNCPGP
ncbi:hypothetical protein EV363DRAFT_1259243 [Boletus edulis]|uniref:Uncharacterized protein n=1 Tax=Boletus edulis BED1 TaxID=1328754 RepID=A0AAD4BH30_BOLED|nr:hypothetical protein EV363DRAFT_1259243 [Boletus edulis]KAF8428500.1 hypothetical protein L210DRAFT_719439 [Boletus edulis BED1]